MLPKEQESELKVHSCQQYRDVSLDVNLIKSLNCNRLFPVRRAGARPVSPTAQHVSDRLKSCGTTNFALTRSNKLGSHVQAQLREV